MKKRGKKYHQAFAQVDRNRLYELEEGISLLKNTSCTKFDATCEVHVKLGIDPKQADQNVRNTVSLPHGSGKDIRVIAFVTEVDKKEALEAGALKAGNDDLINEVAQGFLGFDVAVAKPEMMKKLAKIAKLLGQKGLMPNPKAGTVTVDIAQAIKELKTGKIEFRIDKAGILHNIFGKYSFTKENLIENLKSYLQAIHNARPSSVKGTFIESITLATTMGPGIRLNVQQALKEARGD